MGTLDGKVAIVTGGGRGLGRAMALGLAEAGARVVACALEPDDLEAVRIEARHRCGEDRVHAIAFDVTRPDDCERVVAEALQTFGAVHALFNNAGIGMLLVSDTYTRVPPKFWNVTPDAWARIMAVNASGPFLMARAAVPHMIARGDGRIVNVTTSIHTMQRAGYSPYGPSKAAMEAATRSWMHDLEGTGVTANVLIPGGAADTNLLPGNPGDPGRSGADGNLLSPQLMVAPAVWLVSDAAKGFSGWRIVGRLWDPARPAAENLAQAASPVGLGPFSDG